MDTYPFFQWCNDTGLGTAIRNVTWAFPLIETIHILSLTVLLGSILLMDLRMLGIGIRRIPVSRMQNQLSTYINVSLVVSIVTGVMLFLSEALKAYDNLAFRPKITLLLLAVIFHYTVHNKATSSVKPGGPGWGKVAAVVSLFLWFGVGAAGRAIGFV
jgi:hypothetical protein